MNKKFLIAGNWKMNKTSQETKEFFAELKSLLKKSSFDKNVCELLICPAFTSLHASFETNGNLISLGAQNVYPKNFGAFTGEISISMLKDFVKYVIVGHSERRSIFKESNEFINEKIHALLKANLLPILCVGETLKDRNCGNTFKVINEELEGCLKNVDINGIENITIAYEPIWAIGTGETATPDIAESVHSYIREWLVKRFNKNVASIVRILYGGSLKPSNSKDLFLKPNINGGLIGGAALNASDFISIAEATM